MSDAVEDSSGQPPNASHARVALTLPESALLLGHYTWVEFRLFEVLGSWVANETESEARLLFDIQSRHHAWHCELFAERIPDVDGVVDPGMVTVAPDEPTVELLSTLGGVPGSEEGGGGTLVRLVGLARVVLPRLACGYGYHLSRAAAVSDGPVIRALQLALRDEIEDWQALELLVQRLIRRPHDVAVVTAHQQRLEALVAGSGPGLVSWPGQHEG